MENLVIVFFSAEIFYLYSRYTRELFALICKIPSVDLKVYVRLSSRMYFVALSLFLVNRSRRWIKQIL